MSMDNRSEQEITQTNFKLHLMNNCQPIDFLDSPMLYLDRQMVTLILTRIDLFRKILNVQGSIVECGVYKANSLLTFFHISNILEPYNFNRKIIGFDTFSGFPNVSKGKDPEVAPGYLSAGVNFDRISELIAIQELNKAVSHIKKIELIKGDAITTIPSYLDENPHLIISLLYLDFDLYEPTKIALEKLLPLVPRGGIVGFDELNQKKWSGETEAFKSVLKTNDIRLKRISYDAHVTYFEVA